MLFVFEKMFSSLPVASYVIAHVEKRSNSRSEIFFKTGVLTNFAMFTGKYLRWSRLLIKIQY